MRYLDPGGAYGAELFIRTAMTGLRVMTKISGYIVSPEGVPNCIKQTRGRVISEVWICSSRVKGLVGQGRRRNFNTLYIIVRHKFLYPRWPSG